MLQALSVAQLAWAVGVLLAAYLVRGITGFGSGLIGIPLLALILPVSVVVPMIGLLDLLASFGHGLHHRRAIAWHELLPLLPFTVAGMALALYLFKTADSELLRRLLGGFVLLYALHALIGRVPGGRVSRRWAVPAGGLGGLVNTLFGTGGPFFVIYLQARGLDRLAFRATVAALFLIDGSVRVSGYAVSGFYPADVLILATAALPLMIAAMYAGGHIHTNLSHEHFRQAIGMVLIGSGLALLLRH